MNGWISANERLPDSGENVLLFCEVRPTANTYTCKGFYAQKHRVEGAVNDELGNDYCEDDDTYYLPEGYYEAIHNWDDYGGVAIGDFVTHWMPLPQPPKDTRRWCATCGDLLDDDELPICDTCLQGYGYKKEAT